MATRFNDDQKRAIESHGGTILVSAAAGSGKTAVLTERVSRMLCEEGEHSTQSDRLVVVTFTRAAAAEMRTRIAAKLEKKLQEQPGNMRIMRQLLMLPGAKICTIDSFCMELVRDNFHQLGITPDFRMGSETELALMRQEAARELLGEHYENDMEQSGAFRELIRSVCPSLNDSAVITLLMQMESFLGNELFPLEALDNIEHSFDNIESVEKSVCGKYILSAVRYRLELVRRLYAQAIELAREELAANEKCPYVNQLMAEFAPVEQAIEYAENGKWEQLRSLGSLPRNLRKVSKLANEYFPRIKQLREEAQSIYTSATELLMCSDEEYKQDMLALRPVVAKLCQLVREYMQKMTELKAQRNLLEFSDLQHLAVRLLIERDESGRLVRTALAADQSLLYDEILLDEYQDTNLVQDYIFRALAQREDNVLCQADGSQVYDERNLFMVGDVKQGIYRFRKARTELFTRRMKSCTLCTSDRVVYPALIALGRNYRSRPEVTEAINFFFENLMSESCGDIEYDTTQQLISAGEFAPSLGLETELHIACAANAAGDENTDIIEARYIAKLIRKMLDDGIMISARDDEGRAILRRATPRDFCVMRFSVKNGHGSAIVEELDKLGIGCHLGAAEEFLTLPEVRVALSLLRVLDNPLNDIALSSVMLSPMFGFTPDELSRIRLEKKRERIYNCVRLSADKGDAKCRAMLNMLAHLRVRASLVQTDRLLEEALSKTDYLDAVSGRLGGRMRADNLRLLIKMAADYESAGYKGLTRFLAMVDRLLAGGGDIEQKVQGDNGADAVQVITIHSSKGLEYPICIVSGLSSSLLQSGGDNRPVVMLNQELGIGFKRHEASSSTYPTLSHCAIGQRNNEETLSEKMRLLYVAMTRAKDKLILVGSKKKPEECLEKAASMILCGRVDAHMLYRFSNYTDWLLACALLHPSMKNEYEMLCCERAATHQTACALKVVIEPSEQQGDAAIEQAEGTGQLHQDNKTAPLERSEPDYSLVETIRQRFDYQYPYIHLQGVPAKVTATKLNKDAYGLQYAASSRPAFMMNATRLTPTERGSALHRFMQLCDFDAARSDARAEIDRLVSSGFMNEYEREAVDFSKVSEFFASEIYTLIAKAQQEGRVHRELRFTAVLDEEMCSIFGYENLSGENVVLQGACDLLLEYEDELVVIDYKTDRMTDEQKYIEDYGDQLRLYRGAMRQIFGKRVSRTAIYSFRLGCLINVT